MVVIFRIWIIVLTVITIFLDPISCQILQCPLRWTTDNVNGRCYLVTTDSMNWENAQRTCSQLGGDLAIFRNEKEVEFVKDNIDLTSNVWIGLEYINSDFVWVDGTSAEFTDWAHTKPSLVTGGSLSLKNCVEMYRLKKYQWNNRVCSASNKALCSRKAETMFPVSCPERWYRNHGVCYHISTERTTYDEAAKRCQTLAVGAKFFAPRDSVENNFVSGKLREERINSVWLGINDKEDEDEFETEDSEPQIFFNWDTNEPSDTFKLFKNNDCVKLSPSSKMSDENCQSRHQFVCAIILF